MTRDGFNEAPANSPGNLADLNARACEYAMLQ